MQKIYRKKVLSFLFAGSMLATLPFFVHADHTNAHTIEQLQQQITALLAQVTALQEQLSRQSGSSTIPPPTSVICPRFTYNYYLGMNDGETEGQITALQKILAADSDVYPESLITGYYGPLTEQAVQRYQKKYGIVSSGSPETTGYGVVGPATRRRLLRGCQQVSVLPQVISPNGGESWQIGSTRTIEWSSFKPSSYVDIDLLSQDQPCTATTRPCPASITPGFTVALARKAPNTGSFPWSVGANLSGSIIPTGAYVVRVSNSENAGVSDQSDNYFKITPNDGTVNNSPVISGVSGPTALKVGETGTWTVKASDPAGGALSYYVLWGDETPEIAASAYQNKVQTATFTHTYSREGNFTPAFTVTNSAGFSERTSISVNVGGSVTPTITILSPKQGDQWIVGRAYRISWQPFSPSADTSVYLSGGGNAEGYSKYIGSPSIGTNYYIDYAVTNSDLPVKNGNSWKVAVCNGKMQPGGSNCGWSGEIFVVPPSSSITVLSPNGGEIFRKGENNIIKWQGGGSRVDIYLDDVSTNKTIGCIYSKKFALGTPGVIYWDGNFVSSDCQFSGGADTKVLDGRNYKIRIVDADGSSDISDAPFSIASAPDTTPPLISSVIATTDTPNSENINWSTNEVADTEVDYGTTMAYGQSYVSAPLLTIHPSHLINLSPGTLYHYRVKSKDAAGNIAISSDYTFTTLAAYSFPDLVVSDIYSDAGKLSVKVGNVGTAEAPQGIGHLYIWIDDKLVWTYSVSTWSNQEYRLPGGVTIVQPQTLTGSHKIKATIDPNNVVSESNENNNTLEKTVSF